MLKFKADLPLAKDDANRIMPWIIGFMIYLACLALIFSVSLNRYLKSRDLGGSLSLMVQVTGSAEAKKENAAKLVDFLQESGYFTDVAYVPEEKIISLIEPWIGRQGDTSAIPLPILIEAKVAKRKRVNIEDLRTRIAEISPNALVDSNADWIKRLDRLVGSLQWLSVLVVALVLIVTFAIIVLMLRTTIKLHSETISILNLVGATRQYITRQFQANQLKLALKGGAIGFALLMPTIIPLRILASRLELATPAQSMPSFELLIAPLVIMVIAAVAWLLAKVVVMGMLNRV